MSAPLERAADAVEEVEAKLDYSTPVELATAVLTAALANRDALVAVVAEALHAICVKRWERMPDDWVGTLHGVDAHVETASVAVDAVVAHLLGKEDA